MIGAMPTLAVGMLGGLLGVSHAHEKRGHGTQTYHFIIDRALVDLDHFIRFTD